MCALLLWATPAVALVAADVVVTAALASTATVVDLSESETKTNPVWYQVWLEEDLRRKKQ